ncbi:MAG: 2OG-Fe(II) oxygenase family protein [Steroidobacteraceae bacterium]
MAGRQPEPGSLVVNVGDMLQRLTNNLLRSTTHRVVNPPHERASFARISMPYFLHFNPDFLIDTLPGCISAAHPNAYPEPITADDFLQQRLREIKLK